MSQIPIGETVAGEVETGTSKGVTQPLSYRPFIPASRVLDEKCY